MLLLPYLAENMPFHVDITNVAVVLVSDSTVIVTLGQEYILLHRIEFMLTMLLFPHSTRTVFTDYCKR